MTGRPPGSCPYLPCLPIPGPWQTPRPWASLGHVLAPFPGRTWAGSLLMWTVHEPCPDVCRHSPPETLTTPHTGKAIACPHHRHRTAVHPCPSTCLPLSHSEPFSPGHRPTIAPAIPEPVNRQWTDSCKPFLRHSLTQSHEKVKTFLPVCACLSHFLCLLWELVRPASPVSEFFTGGVRLLSCMSVSSLSPRWSKSQRIF